MSDSPIQFTLVKCLLELAALLGEPHRLIHFFPPQFHEVGAAVILSLQGQNQNAKQAARATYEYSNILVGFCGYRVRAVTSLQPVGLLMMVVKGGELCGQASAVLLTSYLL